MGSKIQPSRIRARGKGDPSAKGNGKDQSAGGRGIGGRKNVTVATSIGYNHKSRCQQSRSTTTSEVESRSIQRQEKAAQH